MSYCKIDELLNKTLIKVDISMDNDEIFFYCNDSAIYKMYHRQDCCEDVSIEDVCGDWNDIIGSPLLMAEESTSDENPKDVHDYSFTWTFYKFATVKGYVTVRWYGESNGYYSESVDFERVDSI
jgi:hypothetical protein